MNIDKIKQIMSLEKTIARRIKLLEQEISEYAIRKMNRLEFGADKLDEIWCHEDEVMELIDNHAQNLKELLTRRKKELWNQLKS